MEKRKIITQKTARYFLSDHNKGRVRSIFIVLHGYGQLAEFFSRKFIPLVNEKILFVFPEGLHRYYLNGHSGRVGASWMTKEAREDDIADNMVLLDNIYAEVKKEFAAQKVNINLIGFSQGGATACRWAFSRPDKIKNLILHSAVFPPDLKFDQESFEQTFNCFCIVADKDEFINEEELNKQREMLDQLKIDSEFIIFEGIHDIEPDSLRKILTRITSSIY